MGVERTPPLSPEVSAEIWEEMHRPPEDTPERRATFERVRRVKERRRRRREEGLR